MSTFLALFLSVYSTMHILFYFRVRVLLPERWFVHGAFVFFLLLMIAAPIGSYLIERSGHDLLARLTAFVGFNWMGFVFLSFWLTVLMGVYDALSLGLRTFTPIGIPLLSGKAPALVMLGTATVLCLYGAFEASGLHIERVSIETEKLPEGIDHFRIVQISDVHLGLFARHMRLKHIVDKLKSLSPDMVVSTGDLIDSAVNHVPDLPELLRGVPARYGKYAVLGNHEVYTGVAEAVRFIRDSGFVLLRGEARTINPVMNIAGVDDPAVGKTVDESQLLRSVQNGLFILLLRHRPEVPQETTGLFDLQLSGHTHRGQIFPFRYIVALRYPLLDGYYKLAEGSRLYTSRGTGSWGPQMRLLAPPEITVFDLERKAQH